MAAPKSLHARVPRVLRLLVHKLQCVATCGASRRLTNKGVAVRLRRGNPIVVLCGLAAASCSAPVAETPPAATDGLQPALTIPTGLVDTAEVALERDSVSGLPSVLPCQGPAGDRPADEAEVNCVVLRATILGNSRMPELRVGLVLRYPVDASPEQLRWVVFDKGGNGYGYGTAMGYPGSYIPNDNNHADELIHDYNVEDGYATLDLLWMCYSGQCGEPLRSWVQPPNPDRDNALGWYRETNATGRRGAGRRLLSLLHWAKANTAVPRLAVHAHSSGAGRVMMALMRFDAEDLVEAVVFDGGPTFSYTPWYCEIDADSAADPQTAVGPLGLQPHNIRLAEHKDTPLPPPGQSPNHAQIYDIAAHASNRFVADEADCSNHVYNERPMLRDSAFLGDRNLGAVKVGIVLGGLDASPANSAARLYLGGTPGFDGLRAARIDVAQGYCSMAAGVGGPDVCGLGDRFCQGGFDFPCDAWRDPALTAQGASLRFDPRLSGVNHDTPRSEAGALVMREMMHGLLAAP